MFLKVYLNVDFILGKFLWVSVIRFFLFVVVVLYVFGIGGVVSVIFERFLVIFMDRGLFILLEWKY